MSVINKTDAMVNYLLECPLVKSNPAYFNFGQIKDNSKQIITSSNDTVLNKPYIDGSVLRLFSFTILDYRSVSDLALVKPTTAGGVTTTYDNENVTDYISSQGIIDWIKQQNDLKNFPNFGESCIIDSIEPLTDTPAYAGVDTSTTPPLARYDTGIRVTYLDTSKQLWS